MRNVLLLRLQVLQEAMEGHLQRGSSGFSSTTGGHAALVATIASWCAAEEQLLAPEDAARAAMRVLSGGLAPHDVAELAEQVQHADEVDAMAALLSALSG
jgi:hypothetical protein